MPDHDEQLQSTSGSITADTGEGSHSADASVAGRVSACERLVEEAIERDLSALALADSLKELGVKAVEAADYIDEFNQRVHQENPIWYFLHYFTKIMQYFTE
jgi:hypothetical protein